MAVWCRKNGGRHCGPTVAACHFQWKKRYDTAMAAHDTGQVGEQAVSGGIARVAYAHAAEVDGENVEGRVGRALYGRGDASHKRVGTVGSHGVDHHAAGTAAAERFHQGGGQGPHEVYSSYIHVGPEIGVASTKAFTGQVTVLTLFALALSKEKQLINDTTYRCIIDELEQIPEKIKEVLKQNQNIAELSRIFTYAHNFIYLGRGYSYPVALEGALKLKEISYIHAEGYPAAEMKHGPIALIDTEMPVVVIATQNAMYEKIISNIQEIKARKGHIIALINPNDTIISKLADECIEIPETLECLEPLITTIPLQLLAYHIAVCKGKDVDQPRNLAKSVTVE